MSQSNTVIELKALAKSLGLKGYSGLRKAELIELIQSSEEKKSSRYSPALIPDITENILSDYIEYDELKELENQISDLKINPKRIETKEIFSIGGKLESTYTYIDGNLRKVQNWYPNGKIEFENNYKNGKLDGPQYHYWKNGNLRSVHNYKNGIRSDEILQYDIGGKLIK